MKENKWWRIWSIEHGCWWRANWNGYTVNKDEAGVYSMEEAVKIVAQANRFLNKKDPPNEAMVAVISEEKI